MITEPVVASTVLMGAFLLAVVAVLGSRGRREPPRVRKRGQAPAAGARVTSQVTTLVLAFVALVAVGALAAFGLSSGSATAIAGAVLAGSFLVLLAAFLVWGAYAMGRSRGLHPSGAAALAGWFGGVLVIVVVVLRLFTA